jgi:hypothetical protein
MKPPATVSVERASFLEGWYCCGYIRPCDCLAEAKPKASVTRVTALVQSWHPALQDISDEKSLQAIFVTSTYIHMLLILEPPELSSTIDREPASTSFGHFSNSF